MKRILLASAAFAALSSTSLAADLPVPVEEQVVEDIWPGFFVGIAGGFSFNQLNTDFDDGLFEDEIDADDFIVGVYYGRNWQWDNWVFGLDSSWNFINLDEDDVLADTGALSPELDVEANLLGLSRLKVGWAFENTLLYVAGGVATTVFDVEDVGIGDDDDDWTFGWTVGAGVEYMFLDNWSARIEYSFFNIESDDIEIADNPIDVELQGHIIRGGIAYHF